MNTVGAFCIVATVVIVAGLIGLIPGAIAFDRKHRNAQAILVCGLCGLIVWPLWFVSLVWAFVDGRLGAKDECDPVPGA